MKYPTKIRTDVIDGFGPWKWPERDTGAWDGPVSDWKSHKETISVLKNKRTAIQAGGCCGLYPVLLSGMFDEVMTFEPDDKNFYFLEQNIKCLSPHINTSKVALGNENKFVAMSAFDETNVGTHTVNENIGPIEMIRLDSFLERAVNEEIDLIWYDLEGYELKALQGSIETIKKHRPMIGAERPTEALEAFLFGLDYEKFTKSEMDVFYLPKGYRS